MTYETVIIGAWLVMLAVWFIGTFSAKRNVRSSGRFRFFAWRIVVIVVLILVLRHTGDGYVLSEPLFLIQPMLGWLAALLTAIGVAYAIWARLALGRNWSGYPTQKEEHELVTNGPYAYVRHPIYTGIILALFGSALSGETIAIVLFLILSVTFLLRMPKEERIMLMLFPSQYPEYRKRTKRLIPFVW